MKLNVVDKALGCEKKHKRQLNVIYQHRLKHHGRKAEKVFW